MESQKIELGRRLLLILLLILALWFFKSKKEVESEPTEQNHPAPTHVEYAIEAKRLNQTFPKECAIISVDT